MSVATETKALITRFDDRSEAADFLDKLKHAGFRSDELDLISPRTLIVARQLLHGARAGGLAGLIIGIFVGAMMCGAFPGSNPMLNVNPFLGVLYGAVVCTLGGFIAGGFVAIFVPPEEAGEAGVAPAAQTLVVIQSADPLRQEKALEILASQPHTPSAS